MNRHLTPRISERLKTAPNSITSLRLILIPILWIFAIMKLPFYIGLGLIMAGLTDFLDGFVARRLNQVTAFGSKLDTLADSLLFTSAIIWVLVFKPEIVTENLALSFLSVLLHALSLLLGWLKFKRFGNLHLYSSKAAALTAYVFLIHAFVFSYHQGLFYIAVGIYILCSTEALILQLTRSYVDEHIGSIISGFRDQNFPSTPPQ
jgi:cardiolipin synthase